MTTSTVSGDYQCPECSSYKTVVTGDPDNGQARMECVSCGGTFFKAIMNKEINQDRVFDTVDHFEKWGDPLAKQDRRIYEKLSLKIVNKSILEAGCGSGMGSAIIEREMDLSCSSFTGSDKSAKNIRFAKCLYPWINFCTWDINLPFDECVFQDSRDYQVVVAVEVFEHVENPQAAMDNLLAAATEEVWLSTPNGIGKPRPPENPYHVCEYTPTEIREMVHKASNGNAFLEMHHWETFEHLVDPHTDVHPLVYHIRKTK